jgi:ribose transport system permease protein
MVKTGFFKKLTKSTVFFIVTFILLYGLILSLVTDNFFSSYNLGIIFKQMSFFGIAALGQTIVLIIAGIDLSVGSTACLGGIFFALLMTQTAINPIICIIIVLIAGTLIGYINGIIITKLKLSPFIVTLAISEISYGFVLVITEGYTISGISGPVLFLGQGMLGPVPVPILIFILIALLFTYILKSTPFGRELYAIGGNAPAARLVGIKVDSKKRMVYAISGCLATFGGIMIACRYNSGQPTIGDSWVMSSITAAVIGGTSMNGGVGTMAGTVIGALLMQMLSNSIVMLNVSQYWEQVMTGGVVLIAVAIDAVRYLSRNKA